MPTDQPARRRRDPQKRIEEITAATEQVIAERGIEGLTHRAVAEKAGVPLGATTYHFATKDDLITAALQRAVDRYAAYLQDWAARRPGLTADQLTVLLTDALLDCFGPQRDQQVLEFELYLAALRRPALRPVADQYIQLTIDTLAHYTDPVTATTAAVAITGLTLRGLAGTQTPTRTEIETCLRRLLTPLPPAPPHDSRV
ncbi:TetR/AcrR family transcriptional regulator [Streptomyces albireticuli]|uniref:TetR family transcriptional regulator n=1 Tax=Streptomyces albireticuli TaxID=1940 RepID=A0A2A2DDN9_9ACTN|nr:TetR family transcriptional regulator [Streptomyces albireticuli]MCD9145384.1 TetR family transcriptional regulator [Streptomyces albireticuli]MCD9165051.1 TetR family transcriptional regulator [Streptomyces albireticuli]MCD9195358.1 TetR family transcriptional regulator [Streptomyces albireticuli]PAU49644.1 TetR family transcriptional regulator [Streptomyces albireticuli]